MRRMVGTCPVCDGHRLDITEVRCRDCGTSVRGSLSLSRLGRLSPEHQDFVEVFIKCRGNIKDVERELGVSYPTVRGRLDRVIRAMGFPVEDASKRRAEILSSLENQEMSAEEAAEALRRLS